MAREKENTLKIKFPFGFPRPNEVELANFLIKHGVKGDKVVACYPEVLINCIFVKFISVEDIEAFLKETGHTVTFEYGNKVKVGVQVSSANEDLRYVRCFEVAPEVEDMDIREAFKDFGEVKQIVWERSKPVPGFDVYNGIRGVHILLKEEIPDFVMIAGEKKRIWYHGMVERCFRCKATGHKRSECPLNAQRRLEEVRKPNVTINLDSPRAFPDLQEKDITNDSDISMSENEEKMLKQPSVSHEPTLPQKTPDLPFQVSSRQSRKRNKKNNAKNRMSPSSDENVVEDLAKRARENYSEQITNTKAGGNERGGLRSSSLSTTGVSAQQMDTSSSKGIDTKV